SGGYESYQQGGDNYYYPDDHVDHEEPTSTSTYDPALARGYSPDPSRQYHRDEPIPVGSATAYNPALAGGYRADPPTKYQPDESVAAGAAASDIRRQPSNASSRYSTVSTDERAGRSYQNSPRFQQSSGFPNVGDPASARLGRSTMGGSSGYDDGGRYD